MDFLLTILILGAATSAASVTISLSHVFRPVRTWIESKSKIGGDLIWCHYCTSHWIGALLLFFWIKSVPIDYPWIFYIVGWLSIVGVSGMISSLIIMGQKS